MSCRKLKSSVFQLTITITSKFTDILRVTLTTTTKIAQQLSFSPQKTEWLRCLLWVKSGRDALKFRRPLYPRKRTPAHAIRMSASGHELFAEVGDGMKG
jgi:hypothetical protein